MNTTVIDNTTPFPGIIGELRQRRGLEPDDESEDDQIAKYGTDRALREVCTWHLGDPSWANTMLRWAGAAGYKIHDPNATR